MWKEVCTSGLRNLNRDQFSLRLKDRFWISFPQPPFLCCSPCVCEERKHRISIFFFLAMATLKQALRGSSGSTKTFHGYMLHVTIRWFRMEHSSFFIPPFPIKKPSAPEKQARGKATRGSPKYLRMLNSAANALKKETTRRLSKYSCYL